MRTAHCPVCLPGGPRELFGSFEAPTDRDLFALIATHAIRVHGAGPAEAFETAADVFPLIAQQYREELSGAQCPRPGQ